jgi:hypothetical protein
MAQQAAQLPAAGEIFLDHVGWYVPDLYAAGQTFARLGFGLTPTALHGDRDPRSGALIRQGSANRLAVLERGYLEFLGAVPGSDTAVARHLRDEMARYVGVHLTAFAVSDAAAEVTRLEEAGFELQPLVNLRREVEGADGNPAEAAFTVLRAAFGSIPEGRMQTLTHHTPEHVWQERFMTAENAVSGLAGVVYAVEDPAQSAARLSAFTGRPATGDDPGETVALDRGWLKFYRPGDLSEFCGLRSIHPPAVAAIGLTSSDLAQTRGFLSAQGVGLLRDEPDRLVIGPEDAAGCALIVEPTG